MPKSDLLFGIFFPDTFGIKFFESIFGIKRKASLGIIFSQGISGIIVFKSNLGIKTQKNILGIIFFKATFGIKHPNCFWHTNIRTKSRKE